METFALAANDCVVDDGGKSLFALVFRRVAVGRKSWATTTKKQKNNGDGRWILIFIFEKHRLDEDVSGLSGAFQRSSFLECPGSALLSLLAEIGREGDMRKTMSWEHLWSAWTRRMVGTGVVDLKISDIGNHDHEKRKR